MSQVRLQGIAVHLGNRIPDQDHAIIMLDPATSRRTQTQVVTPDTTQVVTPMLRRIVSSGVFAKPPKPFLRPNVPLLGV